MNKKRARPPGLTFRAGNEFAYTKAPDNTDLECKAYENEEGRFIEGYASTKIKDSYDDIVEPTAFEGAKEEYFTYGGALMYGHGGWEGLSAIPIGKVLESSWTIDNIGLRVKAQIAKTPEGDAVWELIKMGVLKSFSIGFNIKEYIINEEDKTRTITDLRLYEISVVTIPANPETMFQVSKEYAGQPEFKSLLGSNDGGSTANTPPISTKKEKPMADAEKQQLAQLADQVANHESAVDKVATIETDLKAVQDRINGVLKEVDEKRDQFTKDLITKSEFKEFGDRVMADVKLDLEAQAKLSNEINNKIEVMSRKQTVPDRMHVWRKMIPENRNKSDLDILLHTPVDYNKGGNGQVIKAIHNLWDAKLFLQAVDAKKSEFPAADNIPGKIEDIDKSIVDLVKFYDPSIDIELKAFSTATSSYGSDWALTVPSPEMFDVYDLARVIEGTFRHYTLRGKTDTYPLKTSRGHAYTTTAATTDNPDLYTGTTMGTSTVTFTAKKLYYYIPADEEGIEGDSIVDVIPILREEIAWGLANGVDDAIINGDTTSTHFDTGLTTSTTYTKNAWKGLRRIASDDSKTFDTTSTSTGVGDAAAGFGAGDLRYLRQLCGKHGVRASEFVYALSIAGYFKALGFNETTQPGTYGGAATWSTGELPMLDGARVLLCENISDDLNASGVYDGSTTDYTVAIGYATRGFVVGDRREIRIEFDKEIRAGQWRFVGSVRKDFQKVTPSTEYPVAVGYKIAD